MTRARKLFVLAVLILPLANWAASNGGLPVCCWGGLACPRQSAAVACPMASMHVSGRQCLMKAATHLLLPAPAMPIFPVRLTHAAPFGGATTRALSASLIAPLPAWSPSVFHPPRSFFR